MPLAIHTKFPVNWSAAFYLQLPLLAAIMLEAMIRFSTLRLSAGSDYLLINLQLFFACIPFFIAHYFASKQTLFKALLNWLCGFIAYPLVILILNAQFPAYSNWQYLELQSWLLCTLASGIWLINRRMKSTRTTQYSLWFKRMFSLNGVVLIILTCWSVMTAGVLNTHIEPMLNQPFELVIDIGKTFLQLPNFLGYLWQLLVFSALLFSVYMLNRYALIRKVLTQHGVIAFMLATLIALTVLTPLLSYLALQLPINTLPDGIQNFTPGGDSNIFNPHNYRFVFLLLAISTPLILAFERQQQDAKMTEIAQQQMQTELKLLQQQINPHFLFNTLNNLYALTLTKSDDAPELVLQLANLLRYNVYEGQKKSVNLSMEIEYLQNFIALQAIRSGGKCVFITQWPTSSEQYEIAPLLLIILLENAIKHGVEPTMQASTVELNIQLDGTRLVVYCKNPIHKSNNEQPGGVGLENFQRRLTLLYPNKHIIETIQDGHTWQTTLTLQLQSC